MKPTVTKLKDVRGRRILGYRAAIGPVERDGKTPDEAIKTCEAAALAALRRLDNGSEFHTWHGRAYAIVPTLYGWGYWLSELATPHVYGPHERHEDANASALHHLAQCVWNPNVPNDEVFVADLPDRVREEVARWIRFQRAYAKHRAEGHNDVECHRLACEDSSEGA